MQAKAKNRHQANHCKIITAERLDVRKLFIILEGSTAFPLHSTKPYAIHYLYPTQATTILSTPSAIKISICGPSALVLIVPAPVHILSHELHHESYVLLIARKRPSLPLKQYLWKFAILESTPMHLEIFGDC